MRARLAPFLSLTLTHSHSLSLSLSLSLSFSPSLSLEKRKLEGKAFTAFRSKRKLETRFSPSLQSRKAEGQALSSSLEQEGLLENNGRGHSALPLSLKKGGRGLGSLKEEGRGRRQGVLSSSPLKARLSPPLYRRGSWRARLPHPCFRRQRQRARLSRLVLALSSVLG